MAGGRLKILELPIFNLFRSLRLTPRRELMARFAVRYDNFKLLLESNTELLKIIADIEEKLRGESAFGRSYIEAQTLRTFFHCGRMIECIEKMSGRPYPHLRRTLERIQNAVKGEAADRPAGRPSPTEFVLRYAEIPSRELSVFVGEKNANLAEVRNRVGLAVPRGFAVTTAAFEHFMAANRLEEVVRRLKAKVDIIETETIVQVSEQIQMLIAEAEVPPSLGRVILEAFDELEASVPPARRPLCVSLRSSAIGEDATLSFAGQYLTVLNVPRERVLEEYKNILASLFSPRAIAYRLHMGIPFHEASMAVACLEMIPARTSGVLYTRNPVNPFDNRILIQAVRGLGPYAVDGIVPPDAYVFEKTTPPRLAEKRIAEQSVRLVGLPGGAVAEEEIPEAERGLPSLSDAQAAELAAAALRLEEHFQAPQDVEWALDEAGGVVILQARPLRIEGGEPGEDCPLPPAPPPHAQTLLEGAEIACVGVGCGVAVHVRSEKDLASFPDGGVLVAVHPSPQYVIAMNKAQAIVTDYGGVVCHMASLAREYLVPTLLNARRATAVIPEGAEVTVDAYHGRVYLGRVAEILEAQPQRGGARVRGPAYQTLRRRADLIVPIYLTDPKSPQFGEEHCRTIHDIMRFVHETAYTVIFQLGDLVTDRSRISVRLKAPVPLDLYVIDLFGGLSVDATRTSQVSPEQVVSVPFRALLRGMLHPALCSPHIRPVNLSGFVSVLSEQMLSQPGAGSERFGDRSYAIISDKYLNFSSRVGYHYSVLDSYCGKTAAKNYIHFQFKGGAADDVRRARRARMIEQVLAHYGFLVDTQGDNVRARVSKQEQAQVEELLTMLGSLLLFTRQMDMIMHTEEHVRQLTRCFLEGNFQLDPEGGGGVGCTLPPSAQEERGGGGRGG
ncbi:MAG: PEP/pyruvate-binding domain-containing protein [Desulfobacterales bacterium]